MAESSETVCLAVKRLDLNDTEISDVISLNISKGDSVAEVTHKIRAALEPNDADLIFKLRNTQGHLIPLNGKIADRPSSPSSPLTLEVARRFQSVQPEPNSLTLTQFEDEMVKKLATIQERINQLELAEKNMTERRADRLKQDVFVLQTTVDFMTRRFEESESVHWNGMFIRYPLW
ncbi:unnamed protein product [Candidula unifasciata]|uniref:Uncharacterized protein n=1 Tax=Candidula unifasciata TaxID=100452 RepID=A0A8S4A4S8_9EUPU|nr:unnamed protein product [Candidula unifasciata]